MKAPRFTRRHLFLALTGGAFYGGFRFGHSRLARPGAPSGPLSQDAKALIAQAWAGLDPATVLDAHVHVIGLGAGGTGCTVNPRMLSLTDPWEHLKFSIYLESSGITDEAQADQQYLARLTALIKEQSPHGRLLLMAFDKAHGDDGKPLDAETEFSCPNEYVLSIARSAPDLFVPCASVHPYRTDAVAALEKAVEAGCVAVKWLPNAQNIDPSNARCDTFYSAMARLKVPLISHCGEEKAVHAEERQRLGNPLHLRRALEHGVTTVIAHCASLGQNPDLDAPGTPSVDNFDLFMRLMGEEKWKGLLFGEISALTLVNRVGRPLETVLADPALQARLINGSDYPLPAMNVLMSTSAIERKGFITPAERALLNEIDQHNPLLFDFVIKRTVRLHRGGQEFRLNDAVFTARPEVFPRLARAPGP